MAKSDIIDITCIIKAETEKAILIDHGGKENCWLPKSQIEIELSAAKSSKEKVAVVSLRQSMAEEKGIV